MCSLMFVLSGCHTNPFLTKEVGESLRRAELFEPPKLVTRDVVPLQNAPQELPNEIFESAKRIALAGDDTQSVTLSLAEVRMHALENNLGLKVDLYNPEISRQSYLSERAKYEAVLDATASRQKSYDADGQASETDSITPSVRVPLRTGGTVSLSLPYSSQEADFLTEFGVVGTELHNAGVQVGINQPLLRNGGFGFSRASIDTAGLQMRQTDSRTKLSTIRVLANAERAYWQHYASFEDLRVQIRQYELALEQVRMARRMVEEGVRTKVEVTRAESGVARRFTSVIAAETNRRRSERALKRAINLAGLSVDSDTVIIPSTLPAPEDLLFDRGELLRVSYANRMELLDNEIQQAIDKISVDVSRNLARPLLDFTYQYSYSGSAPESDDAIDQIFERELNGYSATLRTEIPLYGNRAARARLQQSMLQQMQTVAARSSLEQAVREEVYNAADAVEQNWQQILANRLAVQLAEQTYEEEKLQFQLGVVTSTEVLQALSSLTEAQSAQIQALSGYQNAIVDLAFATGTVLGKGGVIWKEETVE
ncbi:MAG: TolC family protein [Proteobacteria bacterium]|nr:TolC family protein [Pseudomonadota bacterium]